MTDFRGEDGEAPFADVTVRMTVPASIGGTHVRVELSNRFGDEPARIGRAAITIGDRSADVAFDGQSSAELPVGGSRWTDPVELTVAYGDDVVVDLYLPEPTPYATANGFTFQRSTPGDFVGSRRFPAPGTGTDSGTGTGTDSDAAPDGTGWSLPAGGPFLRAIEVAGVEANAVMVCLGSSSTAMGWPQFASATLPANARVAVVNRGIAGNRIRLDAPAPTPSWGRAGLSRFDEDVLGTAGVTHLVIAYNSNDFSLPGRVTPIEEMPTVTELIDAYRQLIDRSRAAGLQVILGTINPLEPELADELDREGIRLAINEWIRASGHEFVDFDQAIRSGTDPSRLDVRYDAGDHLHPNVNGQKRLAQAMVETVARAGYGRWPPSPAGSTPRLGQSRPAP